MEDISLLRSLKIWTFLDRIRNHETKFSFTGSIDTCWHVHNSEQQDEVFKGKSKYYFFLCCIYFFSEKVPY